MSWAVAVPAITAAIAGGTTVYGAKKQAGANKQASEIESRAAQEAIALDREKEARRQREYDQMIAAEKAKWEAEQRKLDELDQRESPYRAASLGILGQASDRLGLNLGALGAYPGAMSGSYGTSAAPRVASSPYSSGSLGSLGGLVPTATDPLPEPAPPKMTLADLMKIKTSGDWRAGRIA